MDAYVQRSTEAIKAAGQRYKWKTLRQFGTNIVLSIFALGIGTAVSKRSHDWMWFARSGALITAIQLYVVVQRLKLDSSMAYVTSQLKAWEKTLALYGVADPFPGTKRVIESVRKRYEQLEDRLGFKNESLAVAIAQLGENWLLFISTLIWGFGDLLGKVFH